MDLSENKKNREIIDDFDYLANAASANDCTGLIPEGRCEEEELERYQTLYKFGSPDMKKKEK